MIEGLEQHLKLWCCSELSVHSEAGWAPLGEQGYKLGCQTLVRAKWDWIHTNLKWETVITRGIFD